MESKISPRMDCFQYYCTGNHTPRSGDKSMPQTSHPSIATSGSFFVQMSLLTPGLKFKLKHLLHTKQSLGVVLTIQFSHSLACFALWHYICEAWQWWSRNASLIPIPQSTAIMACSMDSATCTASNDSCSGGLGTKLVLLGCVISLMSGSSSPGEQLVCVDTGGWFCLVVALWATSNSKPTSSGAD